MEREIAAAVKRAREQFPDARIVGRWYEGEPYVEVWYAPNSARTIRI